MLYSLEIGEVQRAFNIEREGVLFLSVKNPSLDTSFNINSNNSVNNPSPTTPTPTTTTTTTTPTNNNPNTNTNNVAGNINSSSTSNISVQPRPIYNTSNPSQARLATSPSNTRSAFIPQSPIQAQYPPSLQQVFQQRRFIPAQPIELLNYKGVEIIVIGESNNLQQELGTTLGDYIEELERVDEQKLSDEKLFLELRMNRSEHPVEPLLTGKWK